MTRCIAVLGASGVGKSTLVDKLCMLEGGAPPPASVETRCASFSFIGEDWAVIDSPGSLEFAQQGMDALLAADVAVVCISPDPEQAVLAAPFIRMVEASGAPFFLFFNRMDETTARVRDMAEAVQSFSRHPVVIRQIPIREDGQIVGSVDLVSERAWRYRPGEPSDLIEIPDDLVDREQEARGEFLENLAEYDDWLLEELIEDRTPASDPIYSICSKVLGNNAVAPSFIGSALKGNGVFRLMKALRHETPQADVLRARLGEGVLAASFLSRHRKHVGKTVHVRVLGGELSAGSRLGGETIGAVNAAEDGRTGAITARPGDLAAVIKAEHLGPGCVYSADAAIAPPDWREVLPPLFSRAIRPENEKDDAKLSEALGKLAGDDPSLSVTHDPESGKQVLSGQGGLHLKRARETLADVFGVTTREEPVFPSFRETVTRKADIHYRHKKQSGGAGQFADVKLSVSPLERGEGFVFDEKIHGGSVPRNYIPAVEAGARETTERGPLGFPVIDVKVTLTDGQHHSVDSSDMAFRIAGRGGVREALEEASPVLLEPFYEVSIHAPSNFTGALNPLAATHRGQVMGFDRDNESEGWDVFRVLMPGAALTDLIADLRSVTQGVGRYEASFSHYQELYGKEADRIVGERSHALGRA